MKNANIGIEIILESGTKTPKRILESPNTLVEKINLGNRTVISLKIRDDGAETGFIPNGGVAVKMSKGESFFYAFPPFTVLAIKDIKDFNKNLNVWNISKCPLCSCLELILTVATREKKVLKKLIELMESGKQIPLGYRGFRKQIVPGTNLIKCKNCDNIFTIDLR